LAWIAAVSAGPFVCLGLQTWSVRLYHAGEPRLTAFFTKLGLAAAISFNLLLSVGLITTVAWLCLRAVLGSVRAKRRCAVDKLEEL
jgi:hypothetical protein